MMCGFTFALACTNSAAHEAYAQCTDVKVNFAKFRLNCALMMTTNGNSSGKWKAREVGKGEGNLKEVGGVGENRKMGHKKSPV